MNPALLPLIVVVPVLAAVVCVVLRARTAVTRVILVGVSGVMMVSGGGLIAVTWSAGPIAHPIGMWPAGIAIPVVVDPFSALMLTVSALLVLACSVFAVAVGDTEHPMFAALVLVLSAGVYGALITGDLFNLYVFIELMLMPSYALLALLGARRSFGATRLFVVINIFASLLLLTGIALVYGTAGSVNLAELAGVADEEPVVAIAAGVVLAALALKSGVVPMHGWLAQTYPFTSPTVSTLFTVLHTKVAVYAIYRFYAVVFDGAERYLGILLVVMVVTMVVGALASIGAGTMRSVLAYQVVSHIGYILLALALFGPLGLTAGIFYLVHNVVVKGSLFLSAGAVEHTYGTGRLDRLSGLVRTESLVAVAFVMAGFSLSGLPPASGFVAKIGLVGAAVRSEEYVAAGAVVVVSLLTLVAMMKVWHGVFWGPTRDEPDAEAQEPVRALTRVRPWAAVPGVFLALLSVALGLGAQGVLALSTEAAQHLVDPSDYVRAVLDA